MACFLQHLVMDLSRIGGKNVPIEDKIEKLKDQRASLQADITITAC